MLRVIVEGILRFQSQAFNNEGKAEVGLPSLLDGCFRGGPSGPCPPARPALLRQSSQQLPLQLCVPHRSPDPRGAARPPESEVHTINTGCLG